jgi:hypothetical protein
MNTRNDATDSGEKSGVADSTPLLPVLIYEARKRGLVRRDANLSVSEIFSLIRDIPYLRASSRKPEAILEEWQGTCSGKHYLLKELFQELGKEARIIMCTHQFTEENSRHFPDALRSQLTSGPVPDVHTYIRLCDRPSNRTNKNVSDGWTLIDATWPSSAADLGMPVNRQYQPGVDMELACDPIDHYEVPENMDPQAFKEELIQSFCGARMSQREFLIEGLGQWLGQHTSK